MTQEEKQLLLKDLSARLSYGVKVQVCNIADYTPTLQGLLGDNLFLQFDYNIKPVKNGVSMYNIINDNVKPYLRPMSSMTKEEEVEWFESVVPTMDCDKQLDFYCKYHFDYRGLIEKGLALEALKDMYKYNN